MTSASLSPDPMPTGPVAAPSLPPTGAVPRQTQRARSVWYFRYRRFRRHKAAVVSVFVLIALTLFSLAAPLVEQILGVSAYKTDLFSRFGPPNASNLLGTDDGGRDVLVRLMYGGQVSLAVGLITALTTAIVGTVLGLVAGYTGGRIDALIMRLTDTVICLPFIPVVIVINAVDLTAFGLTQSQAYSPEVGFLRLVISVTLLSWPTIARLVRATTLSVRSREYVLAAQAQGASAWYIMSTHILPNVVSPIIVATTLAVGGTILAETALSFLGAGIQPPTPSWGNMLNNAQQLIWSNPMLAIYPGMLIFITVIAVNFVGDGLSDAFDPKAQPK